MRDSLAFERTFSQTLRSRRVPARYLAEAVEGKWDTSRPVHLKGENMIYAFSMDDLLYVLHYDAGYRGSQVEYFYGLEGNMLDDVSDISDIVHTAIVHPGQKVSGWYLAAGIAGAAAISLSGLFVDDVRLPLGGATLASLMIEGYRGWNERTERKNDEMAGRMLELLSKPYFRPGSEIEHDFARLAPKILNVHRE